VPFVFPEEPPPPAPPLLETGQYVWEMFCELSSQRGHNNGVFLPLSWADIYAWSTLTNTALTPWEARLLSRLDLTWRVAYARAREPLT